MPPRRAVPLNADLPALRLPTAGSHSHLGHEKFGDAESDLKESFPWPLTPSPPAPVERKLQEIRARDVPTPASSFSTPGLGSAPKVGAPLPGFPPHPWVRRPGTPRGQLTMVTRAAVAPLPGPAAGELGLERSLLGELQKLVPFAKNRLSTPKHSQEPMGTLGGLHPGGIGGGR